MTTLFVLGWTSRATAASGTFMAVMNESTNNADSRKSVTFFDGLDIGKGPLFSVFFPFEIRNGSTNAYEDPSAMTVDPNTGDLYWVAFDNGGTGDVNNYDPNDFDPGSPGVDVPEDDDTIADWDVYRLNFSVVYDHWKTNYEGQDVRDGGFGGPAVGGQLPVYTVGIPAGELDDYVTYGVTTPYVDERKLDAVHGPSTDGVFDNYNLDGTGTNTAPSHSNTFVLGDMTTTGGAIEKVGEVQRNITAPSNFHKPNLEFLSPTALFMTDDARVYKVSGGALNSANDYDYRIIFQKNVLPGFATTDGLNLGDGGFNRTTTESWESRQIDQMKLDEDETGNSVLSEPQAAAYYDAGSVRGVWVVDRDREGGGSNPVPDTPTGDDIAFLQLDSGNNSLGYRAFSNYSGALKFDMLNNPAGAGVDDMAPGRVGQVFVDADTGDLIIVEEGAFDDPALPTPLPGFTEPAVIRVPVNYDDGGQITLGAWGTKMLLTPAKDPGDPIFKERGYWSAYDSANDLVYFMSPGEEDGDNIYEPEIDFAADIYVLDLATGTTTSYLNMDGSVSLFFGGNNTDSGDVMVAFTLAAAGLQGDYNNNGKIDAADYTVWRDAMPGGALSNDDDGLADEGDFTYWRAHFGETSGSGAGSGAAASAAVPEPGSLALLALGLIGLWFGRRNRR